MIQRILRLTAAEFLKLSAHPFLYLALGVMLAGALLAEVLQPLFLGQKETLVQSCFCWKCNSDFRISMSRCTAGGR